MPRHRIQELPLTAAERQARHRAKLGQQNGPPPTAPARRLLPRPRRWAAAVSNVGGSTGRIPRLAREPRPSPGQALPENLEGSRLADKLQVIAELDLEELQVVDPPRGYGRD